MKFLVAFISLLSFSTAVFAGAVATPGPLLGAVAGPWGLFVGGLAYATYRIYRAKR